MTLFLKNIRTLGFCLLGLVASHSVFAATDPDGFWQDVDESAIAERTERWVTPSQYRAATLDFSALSAHLARAPMEGSVELAKSPLTLSLPLPNGGFSEFAMVESPIMEAPLAAKYPSIRTYAGRGISDPTASVRLDVTPLGFHAQVLSASGDYYIDPYQARDNQHYVSYLRRDRGDAGKHYQCGTEDVDLGDEFSSLTATTPDNPTGNSLRTYRMAMAATSVYSQSFGGSVVDGLSGVASTVNRVSGIYEREFSIRLVLVANNDLIIYTPANPGPLPDPPSSFGITQSTINSVIGAANYDLGHAVGASGGGGAITPLGNVCGSQKAQGYTALNPPRGDVFDVDFVAHELGHQLGGSHTWNGCGGGGQWTASSAQEPGSASTIMGYAGICADNLQPNSDAYFHARSFTQIFANTTNGGSGNGNTVCGTVTPTGNTPPNITAPANMTIPERTPFQLTAIGNDPDVGDVLTFNWEQVDTGAQGSPSTTGDNGTAPLFRSFPATTSPTRIFPALTYILNNGNVPPASISFPPSGGSFLPAEILPDPASGSRVMNFRATARDGRALGGGLRHTANVQVTASSTAGPFAVTDIAGPVTGGSSLAVLWSVANTNTAPVNTTLVNILVSLDGGYTFSTLLANTANDGSETITVPATATTQARIKLEAANGPGIGAGNTWFDITNNNFTINASGTPINLTISTAPGDLLAVVQGAPAPAPRTIASIAGGSGPYTASAATSPANPELTVQNLTVSGATVSATAAASCQIAAPNAPSYRTYPAVLNVADSAGRSASAVFPIRVSNNSFPALGTYANQVISRNSTLNVSPSTAPSDVDGNALVLSVFPTTLPGGGTITINPVSGEITINTTPSTTLGSYSIRASVRDNCAAEAFETFTLNVVTVDPALQFNASAVTSGNALLEPNECNTLNVTVGNIGGSAATMVGATLSSTTPGVTIAQSASSYPDINTAAAAVNNVAFEVSTDPAIACGSNVDFTQTVTYAGVGSPTTLNFSLPIGQPASSNYVFASTSGVAAVNGSTLIVGSQADDAALGVTLPAAFAFNVYGTPVTQLRVTTNGVVLFNTAGGSATANTAPLPTSTYSTPTLFAHWDDLDMRTANVTGGGIYSATSGVAPNRTVDLEWRAARYRSSTPTPLSPTIVFTVRLHETTNLIEVIYSTLTGNGGGANGGAAIVGIQETGSGTSFTQFSANAAVLTAGQKLAATRPAGICSPGPAMCLDAMELIFKNGFE